MSKSFALILDLIGSNDVRISEHGYDELAEDDIAVQAILDGAQRGTVIEDYPNYPKGPSVLVLQFDHAGRPIHVVWGIPKGFSRPAVLVTAYRPDLLKWNENFTERRK
ncbi:MAG: hypothetical protein USCGTAYLOR_02976 [Chromatiales bacterium USCg_Taylor]|nr:MAG: hypothetical protein USCGTAYLOR_02976 [Chromatiales bacterium USCg_Taylor]